MASTQRAARQSARKTPIGFTDAARHAGPTAASAATAISVAATVPSVHGSAGVTSTRSPLTRRPASERKQQPKHGAADRVAQALAQHVARDTLRRRAEGQPHADVSPPCGHQHRQQPVEAEGRQRERRTGEAANDAGRHAPRDELLGQDAIQRRRLIERDGAIDSADGGAHPRRQSRASPELVRARIERSVCGNWRVDR